MDSTRPTYNTILSHVRHLSFTWYASEAVVDLRRRYQAVMPSRPTTCALLCSLLSFDRTGGVS